MFFRKAMTVRLNYMFRYSWNALWNQQDRAFSLLNMLSVAITVLILIALTGLLQAFKNYTEAVLSKLPLRIEIFKSKDALVQDLGQMEREICTLSGAKALYKRIPVFLSFVSAANVVVSSQGGLRGCTMSPQEPFVFEDIRGKTIAFLPKEKIPSGQWDEIGICITFDLLKKLGYLPDSAMPGKPESWQGLQLPTQLKIYIADSQSAASGVELPVPILGIVADLARGDYAITEDLYHLLLNWQAPFLYMLCDRHGKPLVTPQPEIVKAHYVLAEDQFSWLEQNNKLLGYYEQSMPVKLVAEFWEANGNFEERLTITPANSKDSVKKTVLDQLELELRKHPVLKNLGTRQDEQQQLRVQGWQDFSTPPRRHQYMQGALYANHRNAIEPTLEQLRTLGLFASSPLERYLKTFARQEQFFVSATVAIFGLVLFLSGVVLFSTFYSSILRKKKEIGIFKAYGASRLLVLLLLYIQSTTIILFGSGLGIICGIPIGKIIAAWLNDFARLSETMLRFYLPLSAIGILVSIMLVTAWLAIFVPARIAVTVDPAEVVRG